LSAGIKSKFWIGIFMVKSLRSKYSVLAESLIFVIGIIIFAVFSHRKILTLIISFAGLIIAGIIINRNIRTLRDFKSLFGFNNISGATFIYLFIAIVFGVLIAVVYRNHQHNFVLPDRLTYFAIIAMLIGSTEELVFRGFIQSHTRYINVIFSVIFATLAHTAYKCTFFIAHQSGYEMDIMFLMKWTIVGGIVFGVLKEYSGNIVPPLAGHAVFDLLVYGDSITVPWWIWS
jgi:membrane protease YdiL (CAAX protease family)